MNLFSLIAALAAAYLAEPAVSTPATGPVAHALAASQVPESLRRELHAAVQWFAEAVAKPLLGARNVDELTSLLLKHHGEAVQARMAIANAANALLAATPPTREDLDPDPDLIAQLDTRGSSEAAHISALLQIAALDFSDYYFFIRERASVSPEQMQAAMTTLVPLATEAEVWLLLALIGLHAEVPPAPEILSTFVGAADTGVLRHRAALHATLRSWDSSWVPSVDAPAWADSPVALALNPTEIDNLVAIFRSPPPPNESLRRALSRR